MKVLSIYLKEWRDMPSPTNLSRVVDASGPISADRLATLRAYMEKLQARNRRADLARLVGAIDRSEEVVDGALDELIEEFRGWLASTGFTPPGRVLLSEEDAQTLRQAWEADRARQVERARARAEYEDWVARGGSGGRCAARGIVPQIEHSVSGRGIETGFDLGKVEAWGRLKVARRSPAPGNEGDESCERCGCAGGDPHGCEHGSDRWRGRG